MEVLLGAKPEVAIGTRAFLAGFAVIAVDDAIANEQYFCDNFTV